ncbi:uncharacterized protein PGTG_16096 [Puccinia graminis f. sp. tritici CRL 75-36-700-3]|uniref:Peptidase S8/S53 domain-containing protein n=1 Tax=Puccinia graminis f. sp. tritici (strain CRL 75-36-700-3 / race SCCL) TaxID=418459 RepID=E3L1T4_PUCGT|nr:uncharacterized protein PGTG_16096 [Puccinia graminis f. sp. tritici CRL 75-36-700-3]EFP90509.2 hypothetical protein PGTG_16096 [Puccinia graminis f. sp. tritici CRL 75-36-700-3]
MHCFSFLRNIAIYTWTISFNFTPSSGKLHGQSVTRYVVEYQNHHALVQNQTAYFRNLLETHLKSNNIGFNDITPFNEAPSIFSGFSLSVHTPHNPKTIKAASFVKAIFPVLPVARPVFLHTPRVLNTLQVGNPADVFEPHVQVGISRLHKKGYRCKGINIAVIDTGCDCQHPALGKGFGKGFKIAKGYDFVGDAYNGSNLPIPDDNPCTSCALHGTHIMGVLAANENTMGFRGVCPDATMSSYRIFGCEENTNDELVASALLRAYKDGADVFSLSVGAPGGWAGGSIAAVIASRIAKRRAVVVSAGNLGDEGMFFATSPSTGTGAISVGSVQSTALVSYPFTTSLTGSRTFNYFATFTMEPGTFPVYPISSTKDGLDDACTPLPANLPNLSQHIALVRRSETHACTFETQLGHLLKKGTHKILWANVCYTFFLPSLIDHCFFDYLLGVATPVQLRITLSQNTSRVMLAAPDSGKVSPFSNYGPMFDLESPQPGVLGVGGNVLSTYPVSEGSFAIASGTSISAPQMAGIAALVISTQGKNINPHEIYTRIASSATPVSNFSETGILESVCHQGAGLVNAWCAAMATTVVSTHSFSLNDTLHFNGTQSFSITNKGKRSVSYTVEHVTAGTALTFSETNVANRWPVPLIPGTADVSFSVYEFVLRPGQTRKLQVKFKAPLGLEEISLPVYSGFVILKSDTECESHTIPYYGVGAALKQRPVLDYGYSYQDNYTLPALDSGLTGLPVEEGHTFTLQGLDVPIVEYRLAFGTPLVLFHIVKGDTVIPTSLLPQQSSQEKAPNPEPHPATTPPPSPKVSSQDSTANSPQNGSIKPFEQLQRWKPRHALADAASIAFSGKIYDLSVANYHHAKPITVPDGKYRILVRALRVTGDPREEEDYEAWLSPIFTIRRSNQKP